MFFFVFFFFKCIHPQVYEFIVSKIRKKCLQINISLIVIFFFVLQSSAEAALIRSQATRPKHYNPKYFQHPKFPMTERDPVYLTEIVTIASIQSIVYKGKALLNFTFCPTPKTGSRYEVRGTVTGIDGQSSYTQYLCTSLPCVVSVMIYTWTLQNSRWQQTY